MRIAFVEGDDLSDKLEQLRAADVREMTSGATLPASLLSVNAYLGAQPIVAALAAGADIVITGRVVDSAVTLAPLVHEFGWSWNEWDKLACGSLAGHIIECGTQCTGGLFTDWEKVPGWDDMGFPIAECDPDGTSFTISKPSNTGGLVTPATVAEQILYEIGDPASYLLPDVICDLRNVTLTQAGPDCVRVMGARGRPAPDTLKVSATWSDGWRILGTLMIGGSAAAAKAGRVGASIIQRCRRMLAERKWPDFTETSLEQLGAESTYGPHARTGHSREVILKIAARHPMREALELLAREIAPSATSMAQGITGFAAGRPAPSPVVRLFSFLVDANMPAIHVFLDGRDIGFAQSPIEEHGIANVAEGATSSDAPDEGPLIRVPLLRIAHGRSGDKGDMSNIGIIARTPAAYRALLNVLTTKVVTDYFSHLATGAVRRYELPGIYGLNFTLQGALGGGGVASLRYDPQGKAFAQMLLDLEVEVPQAALENSA